MDLHLPEGVIFNILSRLPVRLLLQYRCVCKDWCVLIDSTHFKDNYLVLRQHANSSYDRVVGLKLIRHEYYNRGTYKSYMTSWYEDFEPLLALCYASTPSASSSNHDVVEVSSGKNRAHTTIIDHINGIVCVNGGNHGDFREDRIKEKWFDVTLVNPALKQSKKLPVPDLCGQDYECSVENIGFGYDDATNDYKVFAIVTVHELGFPKIGLVYHLSTDSWRILGNMSDFVFHNHFNWDGVFSLSMVGGTLLAHGSVHCIIYSDPNFRILAFSLTTESFQEILFPHDWCYDMDTICPRLLTIDKSTIALAAFSFEKVRRMRRFAEENCVEEQVLDIWVMEEYGNSESWTMLYSISSPPSFWVVLSFWGEDKLLLQPVPLNRLICYDLITGQEHDLQTSGSYDLSEGRQVDEPLGQCDDLICGQPLSWYLQFVSGHESFVSLEQV